MGEAFLQPQHQIAIELHRSHRLSRTVKEPFGEGPTAGPHLQDPIASGQFGRCNDPMENPLVHQPVLAETLARAMGSKAHGQARDPSRLPVSPIEQLAKSSCQRNPAHRLKGRCQWYQGNHHLE